MDALNAEGAYCGECSYEPGWRKCKWCSETLGFYADRMLKLFGVGND